MADEQVAQGLRVDTSTGQSRVEAAPSAPVGSLEAQVDGRRSGSVRAEDGLCEFEKSVAPAVEAFVERAAEVVESIGRFHDAPIMHPPTATRTPYLSAELKRKLRRGLLRLFGGSSFWSSLLALAGFFQQLDISHGSPRDERTSGVFFFGVFFFDGFYSDSTGVVADQPSVEAAPSGEPHGYSLSIPLLR